jgi:hypothetical protein
MDTGTRMALVIAFGAAALAALLGVWLAAGVFLVAGFAVIEETWPRG